MRKKSDSLRSALWLVLVIALAVRVAYFVEHTHSAFFVVPILDEAYYDSVARELAAEAPRDPQALGGGFRPLFYPFLLSMAYRISADWATSVFILVQHAAGAVTALMVTILGARLYGSTGAGLCAGVLTALAAPPLFYEGELLNTSLFTCSLVFQVFLLARAGESAWRWCGCGVWIALISQLRPNALVLVAIFPMMVVIAGRKKGFRAASLGAIGLVGALATVVVVAAIEAPLVGSWRVAGGSGAVNFYLGNKLGADGMVPRQDVAVTYGSGYRDSVELFSEQASAGGDGSESGFWLRRTVSDIRSAPLRWFSLLAAKVSYLISNDEIPNNRSFEFARHYESAILRWLPVRWWLLLGFAPLGAWVASRKAVDPALLAALVVVVALLALAMVAFFVNSRFRAPLWPLMAILAGGGIWSMMCDLRRRAWRRLGLTSGLAAAIAGASLSPWIDQRVLGFGRDFFFRSIAYHQQGELVAADDDIRRSLLLVPFDAAARFQLATIALAKGENEVAFEELTVAARLQPGESRIYNNLGITLERLGRVNAAYDAYEKSLELADDYAPALVNAALIELRAGLLDSAREKIDRAFEIGDRSVSLLCARAFLAYEVGDEARARELLTVAGAIDAAATKALVEDNRRRLSIGRVANAGDAEDESRTRDRN